MPPTNRYWTNSTQGVIVTNRLIVDSDCPNDDCKFTYSSVAASPNITAITFTSVPSGKGALLLTGNSLGITNFNNVKVVL
jgi:hypothetical protein